MHTNHKRVGYVNPLVTAVAGAVVGAGMAIAGAVAMSDKKNQAKVNHVVSDVKNKIEDKKSEVENKTKKLENIAKKTVKDVKNL